MDTTLHHSTSPLCQELEARRLELQARIEGLKTHAERNRLGQFATPTGLARDMLTYARSLLPQDARVRFLDPAFGTGSFFSALLHVFGPSNVESAIGYEIDPQYADPAQALWADTPLRLCVGDFTKSPPPVSRGDKANLVICNPPYVRHHHMSRDEKARLQRATRAAAGVHVNGLAGLYCYFLCLSHQWMQDGALAGWLIPSEFMDVNYGEPVKQYLLDKVTLLRIHRFAPDDVQFTDAYVTSAVVWFRNSVPPADHQVQFSCGGTLLKPHVCSSVPTKLLREEPKWTSFPMGRGATSSEPTLSSLFHISRGLATGANDFFILTPRRASDLQLPAEFLRPVLPAPRYLSVDEIPADDQGNPSGEELLVLLDCSLPEDRVRAEYPSLWRYLQTGVDAGIHQRYLLRHRVPWYSQEKRPASPLLCTYMGRRTRRAAGPFRFILNWSSATATNVYLMLYPKPPLASAFRNDKGLLRTVWQALKSIPEIALVAEGRVYGGGLHKLEPRELANVPAESLLRVLPELRSGISRQPLFPEETAP